MFYESNWDSSLQKILWGCQIPGAHAAQSTLHPQLWTLAFTIQITRNATRNSHHHFPQISCHYYLTHLSALKTNTDTADGE